MNSNKKHLNNAGFTLIEVLVAIAILAIACFPILSYFDNALSTAQRGRRTQRAEIAGESIVEELNTYTKHSDIDKIVATTGSAWEVDTDAEAYASAHPAPTPTADPANPGVPIPIGKMKYIKREMQIDGQDMIAKVTLDYNYMTPTGSTIKYNNFEVPQINALYSENSIVAIDNIDSVQYAVQEFNVLEKGKRSATDIKADLTRKGYIDVAYKTGTTDVYIVKIYYTYTYNPTGSSNVSASDRIFRTPNIVDTEILKEDLKYIYMLYDETASVDEFDVNYDTATGTFLQPDLEKIGLYFICQTHKSVNGGPHSHSLRVSGSSYSKVYTNDHEVLGTPNGKKGYIDKKKEDRIAKITVDIYKKGETTFDDSTRITRVESTKGE